MPGLTAAAQVSHRPTSKTTQKPYKSRFSSKNQLRDRSKGRHEKGVRGLRTTQHQQVMSKFDRKNQAKQMRLQKSKQNEDMISIFKGKDGAPRITAVVPLCDDVTADLAVRCINDGLEVDEHVPQQGAYLAQVDRFKQRVQYLLVRRDLFTALDACRVADFVLFVLSAEKEADALGELILKSVEGQGISNIYVAVQGLEKLDHQKKRQQVLASLKSFTQHFFPSLEKIYSLENRQECLHIIRSVCTTTPKGVHWRDGRSWMFIENVEWSKVSSVGNSEPFAEEPVLIGVVRGQRLKADRLVHVENWGDFQISRITAAPPVQSRKSKENAMAVDDTSPGDALEQPSDDQDTLEELAPEEVIMDDGPPILVSANHKGVLLDDEHYYSEVGEEHNEAVRPRRLPKGTSKYQSAWYLGDEDDSGSDMEDVEDGEQEADANGDVVPSDVMEGLAGPSERSAIEGNEDMSDYPPSEMFLDPSPEEAAEAEGLAEYRVKRRKLDAEEDREFPDEIELHPHVLARERLSKYRGLKSLKTSPWNVEADRPHQPSDWSRLLDISDYRAAKSKVMRESLVGGVKPGMRVQVHLKDVPMSLKEGNEPSKPLALFSLLRHEHKCSCVNVTLILKSDVPRPIKSKEELVVQIGPRRFVVNPLFSQPGATPNDVHKFERFLHPGCTAVASFVAPVTWGSVPVLCFQKPSSGVSESNDTTMMMDTSNSPSPELDLVGQGTTMPSSTSRVIAKRAILTGQPYKIHKKLVTIRYMFFNAEDVAWFKALQLWTNRGRQGTIKESLGTHGYFKAVFDGKINAQDAVGISLYRRVWPRPAKAFTAQ